MAIKAFQEPTPPEDPEVTADLKAIKLAEASCRIAFEKAAHDPSSIEWDRQDRSAGFKRNKDGSADKTTVVSAQSVRAKNQLGALVKSIATCETIKKDDVWLVRKISST